MQPSGKRMHLVITGLHGCQGALIVEPNPYAPPEAKVADPATNSHGLKQRRVVVMMVFVIISFGFYYLVWWFRRRPALNRLNSPTKLAAWPPVLLATWFAIQFVLGLVEGNRPEEAVIGAGGRAAVALFQLAVGILMIIQTFKVKDIIEEHAAPQTESGPMFVEPVKLSGLMTFFFSIFYLQWAINRYVVAKQS
jgi:hypothetical protein